MTSGDAKEQVRQATDIVDLVGRSIALRRQGRIYVGLCPWHNDTKPSLQVNPDRQTWKCWVCDVGGDVFSFTMKQEGCDFREALTMLAERAGIELSRQPQKKAEPGSPDDKNTLYACCEWAARAFHECLLKSDAAKAARDYVQERAITPASVERFNIGFAPDQWNWLTDRAKSTPYSAKVLEAAGLIGQGERGYFERFRGRLIFPIRDTQGRTISFGGRVLPGNTDPRAGKYVNCPETRLYTKSDTLYALDVARHHVAQSRQLIVVEGYTDVILAHQHGVGEAIACCGTAVTERHIRTLRRFADTIYLVLDGDDAGQRRAGEVLELFVAAQVDLRILTLPDELDPAEFVQERGGDALRALLGTATDALEHKIKIATRGIDLVRDTHRANHALEDILGTIARGLPPGAIDSTALRAHQLLSRLSRQFQLEDGDVRTRFSQLRRSVKGRAASAELPPDEPIYKRSAISPCECELLEILDLHPELAPIALAEIGEEDLSSAPAKEILAAYRRREESGQSLDFLAVLGEIENASLKSVLVELDQFAHQKTLKSAFDAPTRLRSVIRRFHQVHEQRELLEQQAALEQRVFNEQEEKDVLRQIVARKQRQLGIVAPTEG